MRFLCKIIGHKWFWNGSGHHRYPFQNYACARCHEEKEVWE